MKNYINITYRSIAKALCSYSPVDSDEWSTQVNDYLDIIKRLPKPQKLALKSAYIFSRKVPQEERQDMFQELVTAILEVNTGDEKFAYAIARRDWQNWWSKYKTRQHFMAGSLNQTITDSSGDEVEIAELIVGEVEFERKMDGKLDAQRIWDMLPKDIQPLVFKRLLGKALTHQERNKLNYYARTKGTHLLLV